MYYCHLLYILGINTETIHGNKCISQATDKSVIYNFKKRNNSVQIEIDKASA